MIWTLIVFGFTMYVLSKVAFPRIQEALDKRANAIRESIEAGGEDRARRPTSCSQEYRERLKEAREQADDIVARARKAAEATKAEAADEGTREARGAASPPPAATSRPRRGARWSRSARRSPT